MHTVPQRAALIPEKKMRDKLGKLGYAVLSSVLLPAGNAAQAAVSTFTNSSTITINDDTTATSYPSNIMVSGLNGTVTQVTLQIFKALAKSLYSMPRGVCLASVFNSRR